MHINDSINSIHPRKSSVCFRLTFYLRSIHARLGLSTSSTPAFSHSGRAPLRNGSYLMCWMKPPSVRKLGGCKCDRKYAIITHRAFRLTSHQIKLQHFPLFPPSQLHLPLKHLSFFLIYKDRSKQACDVEETGVGYLPHATSISHSKLVVRTGHIIENCSWTVYNLVKGCLGN